MDKAALGPAEDKSGDFILAVGVGFLINLILGAGLPQIGPFIAGLVAGSIAKTGPFRGAMAGFLAGTLGELASILLWVMTSLVAFPGALLPFAFEIAVAIVTALSAVMALSGGIVGSVVSLQQGPRIKQFLFTHNIRIPSSHHSASVSMKSED